MDMQVQQQSSKAPQRERGFYGEYSYSVCPAWVHELVADAERAGCWSSGFDGNGERYEAINADVYGWSERDGLALVQVRQVRKRRRRDYLEVRKSYLLIGRLEDGKVFGHGVPSPRRSSTAMASPEAAVRWILAQHVWRCAEDDLDDIVRQGDIALIPIRRMPADAQPIEGETITLRDSHSVRGTIYRSSTGLYARGIVVIDHTPGEHKHVRTKKGLWQIRVGRREALWGFLGREPNAD